MRMERGTSGTDLIEHEGEVIGLAFGGDATTEHECGIRPIRAAFGMKDTYEGIERCRIRKVPQYQWEDNGDEAILVFGHPDLDDIRKRILDFRRSGILACAWSDAEFGIRARGDMRKHLLTFKDAIDRKRAALLLGSGFLIGGFHLILINKFPADANAEWIERDRKNKRLKKAWAKSGVEELLRKAGKEWFSLGGRVIESDDGELRTWLNPQAQHIHNYGWFTFDELRQWARNEGPVMKELHG